MSVNDCETVDLLIERQVYRENDLFNKSEAIRKRREEVLDNFVDSILQEYGITKENTDPYLYSDFKRVVRSGGETTTVLKRLYKSRIVKRILDDKPSITINKHSQPLRFK